MPPDLAALISKHVALFISGCAALFYVVSLLRSPLGDFAPVGLSAFAIIAGLAGVCYTLVQVIDSQKEKVTPLYAAEKFLHSSILLLQTLFLKYAEASVLEFLAAIPWLQRTVELVFYLLFLATGLYGLYFLGTIEAHTELKDLSKWVLSY
jgi:hypothetical protein